MSSFWVLGRETGADEGCGEQLNVCIKTEQSSTASRTWSTWSAVCGVCRRVGTPCSILMQVTVSKQRVKAGAGPCCGTRDYVPSVYPLSPPSTTRSSCTVPSVRIALAPYWARNVEEAQASYDQWCLTGAAAEATKRSVDIGQRHRSRQTRRHHTTACAFTHIINGTPTQTTTTPSACVGANGGRL